MKTEMMSFTYSYFLGGSPAPFLGSNLQQYVNLGLARYRSKEVEDARVDEPLVLMAALAYFNRPTAAPSDRLYSQICKRLNRIQAKERSFTDLLAFHFSVSFDQPRRLAKFLHILNDFDSLGSKYARLVAYRDLSSGSPYPRRGTWMISGFNDRDLPEYGGILNASDSKSYAFDKIIKSDDQFGMLCPDSMGPSLLFMLELTDTPSGDSHPTYVWVAVAAVVRWGGRDFTPDQVASALRAVTPKLFFSHPVSIHVFKRNHSPIGHPSRRTLMIERTLYRLSKTGYPRMRVTRRLASIVSFALLLEFQKSNRKLFLCHIQMKMIRTTTR